MNSDGDKVYKEIVAEHNMKRQKKDKIYKTSSIVSRGMFYVASVLLILYSIINYYYVNHIHTAFCHTGNYKSADKTINCYG